MWKFTLGITLGSIASAWAWAPVDEGEVSQVSTTRVAEIRVAQSMGGQLNQPHVWVRFEDDTAQLCVRQGNVPRFLTGRDPLSFVWVGIASDQHVKTVVSTLLTARASAAEVTVVIDSRECRLHSTAL